MANYTLRWDQALPAAQRFVVLRAFNNAAVLDKNTGLVWEKSPETTTGSWNTARSVCIEKNIGGQRGWRLPSIVELTSLIDPSLISPGPTLPAGHPFTNVQTANNYWSATTDAEDPTRVWNVTFLHGLVGNLNKTHDDLFWWCVRGGMNADHY